MTNKTIYMTYKKEVPSLVFDRWKELNPTYNIDFSLDEDCIQFLKENFNDYIVNLFKTITDGRYKADLWRLCKLYINGGIYADVDLVPYLNIDTLDKRITFYSCLDFEKKGIFQAFMINFSKPKNPLILHFLISFLLNSPFKIINGPTYDMYNCIRYNLKKLTIIPEEKYEIKEITIPVNIGTSETYTKNIDLHYFPSDDEIEYSIKLIENPYKDTFEFSIENNILKITRVDENREWGHNHYINICIKSNESIFLFKENCDSHWSTAYVLLNNTRILDSRDINYYNNNRGW